MSVWDLREAETWQHRAAASAAIVLLVGSGLAYRAASPRVADIFDIAPLPPGTLNGLPLSLGGWLGENAPIDKDILRIADVDDYVNRVYRDPQGGDAVSLFVAFRRRDVAYGVPVRELMPHRPDVCYPSVGWKPDGEETTQVLMADGSQFPVRIFRFHRGELAAERVTVLVYYIVDGSRSIDVASIRPSGWRPKGLIRYVAQIQIACNERLMASPPRDQVRRFAAASAPAIQSLLRDATSGAATK